MRVVCFRCLLVHVRVLFGLYWLWLLCLSFFVLGLVFCCCRRVGFVGLFLLCFCSTTCVLCLCVCFAVVLRIVDKSIVLFVCVLFVCSFVSVRGLFVMVLYSCF